MIEGLFRRAGTRGALVFVVASGGVGLSNFIFHIIMSRLLGPSSYGALGALLNVTTVATVPLAAVQVIVAQSIATRPNPQDTPPLGRLLRIAALASLAALALWLAATPTLDRFFHLRSPHATIVLGVWLVCSIVNSVLEGVLLGQRRFRVVGAGQLVGAGARLAAGVVLVAAGLGVLGGVGATVAASAVVLVVYAVALRSALFAGGRFVPRRDDALRSAIALGGTALLTSLDAWLGRHFLPAHAAGLFVAATTAGNIALFLPGAITTVYFPRLAASGGRGADARQALARSVALVALVSLGAAGGMALLPGLTVGLLFGAAFSHARVALGTVAVADAAVAIASCLVYYQVARRSRLAMAPWLCVGLAVVLAATFHGSLEVLAIDMVVSCWALVVALGVPSALSALRSLADDASSLPRQAILLEPATLDVTVVVPCYNVGSSRLAAHLQAICATLSRVGVTFEVLPVSDGSTDDSATAFDRLPAELVHPIVWTENRGKGEALRAGLAAGRGRYLGFIDGDGDIPADVLASFVSTVQQARPDVVVGSKRHRDARVDYPPLRRICSVGYQLLTGALFGLSVRDTQTGVKLLRRDVVAEVLPRMVQKRYAFDLEFLAVARRLGYRHVAELPVTIGERFSSTISVASVWRMLQDTLATFYRLRVLGFYDPPLADLTAPWPVPDASDLAALVEAGRRLRILICNWRDLAHPLSGGAEVYTHRVARAWAAIGHQVTWFCAAVPGRPSVEVVDGISIVRRGGRQSVYRQARRYFERQGRGRFDLVVDEVNTRPFDAQRWAGTAPVVAVVHQVAREVWFHELPWPIAVLGRFVLEPRWLRRLRSLPVMTVSASSAASLRAFGITDVSVVREGLDTVPRPVVAREERPTVLFVGRLATNKRPDHAIEAFRIMRRQVPDAQMWVVGTGPMEDALRRTLPEGVALLGRVDEPEKRERLARAHCLVATSVREGWGLVVSEAAQVGTPTIGYDVDGLRDSVTASSGVLVAPRPDALAETLVAHLPRWAAGEMPRVQAGGVQPWPGVAEDLLHVAVDRLGHRRQAAAAGEGEDVAVAWRRAMAPVAAACDRRAWSVLGLAALIGIAPATEAHAAALASWLAATALGCLVLASAGTLAETLRARPPRRLPSLDHLRQDPKGRKHVRWAPALVVGVIAAAAAQSWFGGRISLAGQTMGHMWARQLAIAWSRAGPGAGHAYTAAMGLPLGTLAAAVHLLGGSSALAERLWLTGLFGAVGASMAIFLTVLGLGSTAAVAGALAYAFSPYVVAMSGIDATYLAAMILVPALLAWVAIASQRAHFSWRLCLGLAPVALLMGVSAESPPLMACCILAMAGGILVAGWLGGRRALLSAVRHSAVAAVPVLIVASYWLVPFLVALVSTHLLAEAAHLRWQWSEARAGLANGFWLNTSWSWGNALQFPYASAFGRFPLVLWRYALPVAAFATLGVSTLHAGDRASSRLLRVTTISALMALFVVLLSTGTQMPGAPIYDLLRALPFGFLVADPGRFLFVAGFGYATMLAVLVDRSPLLSGILVFGDLRVSARLRAGLALTTVLFCAAILVPAFPLVTGSVSAIQPPRSQAAGHSRSAPAVTVTTRSRLDLPVENGD